MKKIIFGLKLITIILVALVELMIPIHFWIGNNISTYFTPIKAYFILSILIIIISIIDKLFLTLVDLFKALINKSYRSNRIIELKKELEDEKKLVKIFIKIFHLIIFENTWLVLIVFILHSSEWVINGWNLINGKVTEVGLYSLLMRIFEYPIVIITFIFSFFKNREKYMKILKKQK